MLFWVWATDMPQVCLCSSVLSRQRAWGDAEGGPCWIFLYSSFLPSIFLFSLSSFSPSIGNGHHHFLLSPNSKQFCRAQLQQLMSQKARLRTVEIKQWKHLWTAGRGHRQGPRDPAFPTPVPSGSLLLAGLYFFFVKILTTRFQSDHSDIICGRTGLKRTITAAEARRFLRAERFDNFPGQWFP